MSGFTVGGVLLVLAVAAGASACQIDSFRGPQASLQPASLDAGTAPVVADGGHGPVDFIAGAKEGQVGRLEADDSCFILHRTVMLSDEDVTRVTKQRYAKDSAECLLMRAAAVSFQATATRLDQCKKEKDDLYKQCVAELDKVKKESDQHRVGEKK